MYLNTFIGILYKIINCFTDYDESYDLMTFLKTNQNCLALNSVIGFQLFRF